MINENLYINVKKIICKNIYQGTYEEGDKLPPERRLCEELGVSRVTLRKALSLLEEEGIIERAVGSGTRIRFQNRGYNSPMDMIGLVAPANNPFFSRFIEAFQKEAGRTDSLVLYVQKPPKETLENCLYRLYDRGILNVAVWPAGYTADQEKLKRLRALGLNMVFFDTNLGLPFADCVSLDNEKAIEALYRRLRQEGAEKIAYLGWNRMDIFSVRQRKRAFEKLSPGGIILKAPDWEHKEEAEATIIKELKRLQEEGQCPDALLCGDRECGNYAVKALQENGYRNIKAASVDRITDSALFTTISCVQDFKEETKAILKCLDRQKSRQNRWKAKFYPVEGKIRSHDPDTQKNK